MPVCSFEQVVQALDLRTSDLFPATSKTEDPEGEVVAKEVPSQRLQTTRHPPTSNQRSCPVSQNRLSAEGSQRDWAVFAQRRQDEAGDPVVEMLAGELGVSAAALRQLQIGWHENQKCYTFPERNGKGEVVGISCRSEERQQESGQGQQTRPDIRGGLGPGRRAVADTGRGQRYGGRVDDGHGRCWPAFCHRRFERPGRAAERFSGTSGHHCRRRDGCQSPTEAGRAGMPLQNMANKLAAKLNRPVKWCLPPDKAKDIRAWLGQQGTAADPAELGRAFLQGVKWHEVAATDNSGSSSSTRRRWRRPISSWSGWSTDVLVAAASRASSAGQRRR